MSTEAVRYVGPHREVELTDPETQQVHVVALGDTIEVRAGLADKLREQHVWVDASVEASEEVIVRANELVVDLDQVGPHDPTLADVEGFHSSRADAIEAVANPTPPSELEESTVAELHELAGTLGLTGLSKANKSELIEGIEAHTATTPVEPDEDED